MSTENVHINDALFSHCRKYRYALWRELTPGHSVFGDTCVFIGLNPSTADETLNDPTIRRCMNFSRDWGYHKLCMLNLFAFRATDPKAMLIADDPIGPNNNRAIEQNTRGAMMIVAAWGVHGAHLDRTRWIREWCGNSLHHLGLTKDGHPKHPLYLPKSTKPTLWVPPQKGGSE